MLSATTARSRITEVLVSTCSRLSPPAVQYLDFARWQRRQLDGDGATGYLAWWRDRLTGAEPLELPRDRPRPPVQGHRGDSIIFEIDAELSAAVRRVATASGATPYMVMLSAFLVLLRRYSGQTDLSVGIPIAGRDRAELHGTVGFLMNVLVLRVDLSGDPSFIELVERVRQTVLNALAHQDAPFEKIVEAVNPIRDLSRSPLFQVVFGIGVPGARTAGWSVDGLAAEPQPLPYKLSKYDMSVNLDELADGSFRATWQFDAGLFDRATVTPMTTHFLQLATTFTEDETQSIGAHAATPHASHHE